MNRLTASATAGIGYRHCKTKEAISEKIFVPFPWFEVFLTPRRLNFCKKMCIFACELRAEVFAVCLFVFYEMYTSNAGEMLKEYAAGTAERGGDDIGVKDKTTIYN